MTATTLLLLILASPASADPLLPPPSCYLCVEYCEAACEARCVQEYTSCACCGGGVNCEARLEFCKDMCFMRPNACELSCCGM